MGCLVEWERLSDECREGDEVKDEFVAEGGKKEENRAKNLDVEKKRKK